MIDLTEAAYDLDLDDTHWLPTVLRRGLPVLDHGLGVAGWEYGHPPDGGDVQHRNVHVASGPQDFAERHVRGAAAAPPEVLRLGLRSGRATTGSQLAKELGRPDALQIYVSHIGYCKDVLYLAAVNPDGAGVAIIAPLEEITTLSWNESRQWQMLAAHIEAGHRLREGIALAEEEQGAAGDFPFEAEAILDARNFRVTDAAGAARRPTASQRLREAAVAIDRARGRMRNTDPRKALEGWKALVHGRWSVVDWFDTDGRRFVLAIPNAPEITDPRGLTARESQVAWMAAAGMTNKLIAYRLGLSTSRISLVLRTAMRKLGVRTRTQLAHRIGDFPAPETA
ncbi:MAG: helix-turn-helix transcriptional regulator [Polyangiales bacterium]